MGIRTSAQALEVIRQYEKHGVNYQVINETILKHEKLNKFIEDIVLGPLNCETIIDNGFSAYGIVTIDVLLHGKAARYIFLKKDIEGAVYGTRNIVQ